MRRALAWSLLAGATAFALVLFLREERSAGRAARSRTPEVLATVPHFALVERSGSSFGLGDLAGSPWIADFVFTRCRMSCPLLTRKMLELRGRLPASTRARLVSVSVDPEHDTPEVLRRYAAENGIDGPGWVFLTGGRTQILGVPPTDTTFSAKATGATVGAWAAQAALPEARSNHTAVVARDCLFVIGGGNGAGGLDTVYRARVRHSVAQ